MKFFNCSFFGTSQDFRHCNFARTFTDYKVNSYTFIYRSSACYALADNIASSNCIAIFFCHISCRKTCIFQCNLCIFSCCVHNCRHRSLSGFFSFADSNIYCSSFCLFSSYIRRSFNNFSFFYSIMIAFCKIHQETFLFQTVFCFFFGFPFYIRNSYQFHFFKGDGNFYSGTFFNNCILFHALPHDLAFFVFITFFASCGSDAYTHFI